MSWLTEQYAERKRTAESLVARWVWYSDQLYAVDPLHFVRSRSRPGVPLDEGSAAQYAYGLAADGSVVVERQLTSIDQAHYETFFVLGEHGPVEVARYDYSPGKKAIRHETFGYQDSRLDRSAYQAIGGCGRSSYRYEDGRLTAIELELGERPDALRPYEHVRVSYDGRGELDQVAIKDAESGWTEVAYRSLPAGQSIEDIKRRFVERLVTTVRAAVEAARISSRPACLALLYSPGQFAVLPPTIAIPTSDGAEGIAEFLQNADWRDLELDDHELKELAGLLDQQPLEDEELQAILNEACRQLNSVDWRRLLEMDEDFLVFATDLEHVHLEANLRAVTSEQKAARIAALAY